MATNYEKIKNMSIEEMALYIVQNRRKLFDIPVCYGLTGIIKQWLQQEATDEL